MKSFCLFATLVSLLAGCAGNPRFDRGMEWVLDQEAERQRLEAQGFPQYTHK